MNNEERNKLEGLNEMDKIVICPKCKQEEKYGEMHWSNGRQFCRSCIQKVWLGEIKSEEMKLAL